MKHKVRIPIGDWSNDGHGQCTYFTYECTINMSTMKRAYKRARGKLPTVLDPMRNCGNYEECTIPEMRFVELTDKWPSLLTAGENLFVPGEDFYVCPEFMAEWVMVFIQSGSETMEYNLIPDATSFWPLGQFGYGLFH